MIITNLRCPTHGSYSGRVTSRGRDTKCPHCDFDGRVRDIDPPVGAHVLPSAADQLRIRAAKIQTKPESIMRVAQSNFVVYLAGAITGLTYDGAEDWREYARAALADHGIKAVSPLRAKDYLRALSGAISGTGEEYSHLGVLSTPRGVMTRDRYDATRCDVLLVNLLGTARVSIGTVMEIAWADACRTPIVCAMEAKGNPHEHMMIGEAIGFRVPTLDEALHVVKAIADNGVAR